MRDSMAMTLAKTAARKTTRETIKGITPPNSLLRAGALALGAFVITQSAKRISKKLPKGLTEKS